MRNKKKLMGITYTPPELANFVSSRILKYTEINKKLKILDPACGDGELLLSIYNKIKKIGNIELNGYDIEKEAILNIKKRIKVPEEGSLNFLQKDFLNELVRLKSTTFNGKFNNNKFDVIICNPPYVRTQNIEKKTINKISKLFNFTGRLDLYHAFSAGLKYFLNENGVVGLIISNRFMSVKSGEFLRKYFLTEYSIEEVYDFGDTKLFKDSVLPSVLILKNKTKKNKYPLFKSIYEIKKISNYQKINKYNNVINSLENSSDCLVKINEKIFSIKVGHLNTSEELNTWGVVNDQTKLFDNKIKKNTYCHFGDVAKSKVGVKTTADNVFLINNEQIKKFNIENKLVKNLIIHKNIQKWKCNSTVYKKILYPYESFKGSKKVIDLNKYVNAKKYLKSHYKQLNARSYISKSNKKWYEIWVPHNPEDWKRDKIVFKDISEEGCFSLVENDHVINGNCYWMKIEKKYENLKWLILAIGNSKFILKFYDNKFSNKLYSNKRRFISQYIDQFPLPNPENKFSVEIIKIVKKIYKEYKNISSKELIFLENKIDDLIYSAFQLK